MGPGLTSASNHNPLNLIERYLVLSPVVQLRRPWRLVSSHLLGLLDGPATFKVDGGASRCQTRFLVIGPGLVTPGSFGGVRLGVRRFKVLVFSGCKSRLATGCPPLTSIAPGNTARPAAASKSDRFVGADCLCRFAISCFGFRKGYRFFQIDRLCRSRNPGKSRIHATDLREM
jgi:hypothetical protein